MLAQLRDNFFTRRCCDHFQFFSVSVFSLVAFKACHLFSKMKDLRFQIPRLIDTFCTSTGRRVARAAASHHHCQRINGEVIGGCCCCHYPIR